MKKNELKTKLVSVTFIALMLCSTFAGAVSAENTSEGLSDNTILNETGRYSDTLNSSDNHSLSSEIDGVLASASISNGIVINEIMFNPLVEDAGDEWVEIYNPGNETRNIDGWTISNRTGVVAATLPNWDLSGGTYLVLHFGNGTNDNNFTDGNGHFYTNDSIEVFNNTEDECALDLLLINSYLY